MIGDLFDSPWKILIVAAVIIVLFGSAKLPHAARSLGKSMRILKTEIKDLHDEPEATVPVPAAVAPPLTAEQLTVAQQQLVAEQAQQRIDELQRQLADLEGPVRAATVQHVQ
jgi:sec-independent protein translocase protein TatA